MKIALTGASGFIGTTIQEKLTDICNEFLILKRGDQIQTWQNSIEKADVVINLAGFSVFNRWTRANKKRIMDSRIVTTQKLVAIINKLPADKSPKLLISISATGIYPDDSQTVFNEDSKEKGNNFLSEVVKQWEEEANELVNPNVRLIIMRLGLVLAKNVKMIRAILPFFKVGMGGKIGSGKQLMSFIYIDDLIAAIRFFIINKETSGHYNVVSPMPITNSHFTKALGKALHRPTFLTIPAFIIKLIYGDASRIMLKGANVYPDHLVKQGFTYKYPTIEAISEKICK